MNSSYSFKILVTIRTDFHESKVLSAFISALNLDP